MVGIRERSPESLSSAPPLSACGRSTALAAMHSCHPGERTLPRAGAAASALLDFDIATHADLAAANGGDLCVRKKPSLAAFSLSNRRCRIRFQAHRRAQVPVQIIKGGNHE